MTHLLEEEKEEKEDEGNNKEITFEGEPAPEVTAEVSSFDDVIFSQNF